ncbi:hypothetical protein HCA58_04840 [Micromonospora sp. HNM0581]|uniref:hypothetical protein n=1 Tax=Micromonospora sp. HNM0581 TaxID=2716341 RepID=UPI00146F0F3A|nr:hypothetical protein [Micromonospora sp. HNM0581]NLU77733.1 hypothetical protein [Micromonospora sp. HNM0581]
MVNWVTRGDVVEASKSGANFIAIAFMVVVGLFAGAWWWATGRPLLIEPRMHPALRLLLRGGLFVGAFVLAYAEHPWGLVGTAGVFVMAGAGWWLMATDES